MDGFLDVTDARSSFQSRERKLEILKDPHAGAFAIAGCGVYLLLYTAAFSELRLEAFPAIGGIYVMTRALSGLSVLCFPKARKGWTGSYVCQRNRKRSTGSQSSAGSLASGGNCVCISGIRYRHGSGPDSGSSGSVSLVSSWPCMNLAEPPVIWPDTFTDRGAGDGCGTGRVRPPVGRHDVGSAPT